MYQQDRSNFFSSKNYPNGEENFDSGYGYNYRNYRLPSETGIKGKIEQKYWRSKQKVIEKLGKEQDEFVIAGDAEVDARLEAFQHIKMTCMQLMVAIEFYQNKIFALSQDENEMGRFLRDQGALDKTKAGKMMIAVGKAQSYAAQQRLGLRASLSRLFSELETFRFRAIQDTQLTVTKMEQARSDYRARLLWMADISKELDPDQMKRLDKFRDVQLKVKLAKTSFDKLKGDVIQKIDLLSASRCNLLSATLEPYQTAMITFLSSTSKSYNVVYQQFQGYPAYQFQVLKNIMPNNGIVDDDDDVNDSEDPVKRREDKKRKKRGIEAGEEVTEKNSTTTGSKDNGDDDDDDKLINFDLTPPEEVSAPPPTQPKGEQSGDLLGNFGADLSPGFGDYSSGNQTETKNERKFEDLLGGLNENLTTAAPSSTDNQPSYGMTLLGGSHDDAPLQTHPSTHKGAVESNGKISSVDELLFGGPTRESESERDDSLKSDMDLLSDVLNNQSLGINEKELNNSFSSQWQSMFGAAEMPVTENAVNNIKSVPQNNEVNMEDQTFMPSFLFDQIGKPAPASLPVAKGPSNIKDSTKFSKPPHGNAGQKIDPHGKDMSAWFSLFADLDPLANPDALGLSDIAADRKQAC